MAYITYTDVQSLIGNPFTIPESYAASSYAKTAQAIARATEKIDAFTGQHFEPVNRMLVLSGDGTDMLSIMTITTWGLASVTEILQKDNYSATFDVDGYAIDAAAYRIHESRRFVQRIDGDVWTAGQGNFRMTAAFGKATVPPVIKQAAVLLVRNEMEPGHIDGWMPMYQESFPDGYSYMRAVESGNVRTTSPLTTGHTFVDQLLLAYRMVIPTLMAGV